MPREGIPFASSDDFSHSLPNNLPIETPPLRLTTSSPAQGPFLGLCVSGEFPFSVLLTIVSEYSLHKELLHKEFTVLQNNTFCLQRWCHMISIDKCVPYGTMTHNETSTFKLLASGSIRLTT